MIRIQNMQFRITNLGGQLITDPPSSDSDSQHNMDVNNWQDNFNKEILRI